MSELKAFLDLIYYYGKFLPNLSTILNPLYSLLHKYRKWNWKSEQEEAFKKAKYLIRSFSVFSHYDGTQKLVKTGYCQRIEEGAEWPIVFASRTFSLTEKNTCNLMN